MSDNNLETTSSTRAMQKWGGLASFLLVTGFIVAPFIYLVGNLRDALGPFAYSLADFMYGPLWAASLVTAVSALRERIGGRAPRRMSWALLTAVLAAGAMVLVACIRAANRQYHLMHPELHLEDSTTVLVIWTTLVAGVTAAGWHFLGWSLMLAASAGWTSGRLPRVLCALYLVGGIASLFVFVFPVLEGAAALLGVIWAVWQGVLLWNGGKEET
ncbi:MAG: hypothetical protein HY869_09515 [Chloroflexi bacterium]|nr:hypothetical protein [Chloroflexota bacterium]